MKTIVENATKESKYLLNDAEWVGIESSRIVVGQPEDFIILDLNSSNSTLVENVTPPEDWNSCKYFYDAGTWTLNPEWVDPTQPVVR